MHVKCKQMVLGSNVGISLISQIEQKWSGKVQVLGEYNEFTMDYEAKLDVFQIGYDYNSNIRFRAGRTRMSAWLYSLVLQVGALYPWIAPPVEVYGKNPVESFNGVMITYNAELFNHYLTADLFAGNEKQRIGDEDIYVDINIKDILGLNLTYGNDFLSFRHGLFKGFTEASIKTISRSTVATGTTSNTL